MHQVEEQQRFEREPMDRANARIDEIIRTAEAAAGEIIETAEAEAERYVDEVRRQSERDAEEHAHAIAALSDSLIEQAEALSRQSKQILDGLGGNGSGAAQPGEAEPQGYAAPAPAWQAPWQHASPPPAPEPPAQVPSEPHVARHGEAPAQPPPEPQSPPPQQARPGVEDYSAGARLLATQMAVAGSSREEIRDRLCNDFEIANPEPLLDAIARR